MVASLLFRNMDWKGDKISTLGRLPDPDNPGEITLWSKEVLGWMFKTYFAPIEKIDMMTEDEVEALDGIMSFFALSKYSRRDPSVQWMRERARAEREYHGTWWKHKEDVMIAQERGYKPSVVEERRAKMNEVREMALRRKQLQLNRIDNKYRTRIEAMEENPIFTNHPLVLWFKRLQNREPVAFPGSSRRESLQRKMETPEARKERALPTHLLRDLPHT